jgi:hypothetical protein
VIRVVRYIIIWREHTKSCLPQLQGELPYPLAMIPVYKQWTYIYDGNQILCSSPTQIEEHLYISCLCTLSHVLPPLGYTLLCSESMNCCVVALHQAFVLSQIFSFHQNFTSHSVSLITFWREQFLALAETSSYFYNLNAGWCIPVYQPKLQGGCRLPP